MDLKAVLYQILSTFGVLRFTFNVCQLCLTVLDLNRRLFSVILDFTALLTENRMSSCGCAYHLWLCSRYIATTRLSSNVD